MILKEFDCNTYSRDKMIIVYGTEGFGRIVHYCLKQKNIIPDYYVNKKGKGYICGVPIIDINRLSELYEEKEPIILLAVGQASKEVILTLSAKKINVVYSIYSLLEDAINIGDLIDPIYSQRSYYLSQQESFIKCNELILNTLDIVVTEKCSLKCEKCSNLMQYYQNPKNIDIYGIRKSLNKMLEVVDCIYELRILGGEPFMNPDFYGLIDWYKDNSKIKQIVVMTNATIFPEENKLDKLKNSKVKIWLSDYGKLSTKLCDWMKWCESNKVEYLYRHFDSWNDCGKLEKRNYSSSEIKYIYETCGCRQLPTLLNGKLFNCPYAANAINLGVLYENEAQKDMLQIDHLDITKEMLKDFLFEKNYLAACDYCSGRNVHRGFVEPYVQTETPLPYEKRSISS